MYLHRFTCHQSCHFHHRMWWASRGSHWMVWRQIPQSWNNLANQDLEQQITPLSQRVHLCWTAPECINIDVLRIIYENGRGLRRKSILDAHCVFTSLQKKEPVLCGFCAVNRSLSHQCVSVHEHTLAVLRERPAVQFGERHPQVRTLHQGQMSWIAWIHHVHHMHLIKNGAQHISIEQTVWFTSACMSPLILR